MSDDRDEVSGSAPTLREGPGARAAPPASDPDPTLPDVRRERLSRGTLVDRYVVLDVIGEGGMGVVYRAVDPDLDRKVAIKLLQARADGSGGGENAWLVREAQALAKLSHPNVVVVHDVGALPPDRLFVAMELVDGATLRSWLRERRRSWREILGVLRAAGAGLAAAHEAGLVHRDFKPDNVMVGTDGRVRVMDFGLARVQRRDDAPGDAETSRSSRSTLSDRLTEVGAVVGTPAYIAPEVYGGQPADARADQFAFGVTCYEALFGTRPYQTYELAPGEAPARPKPPAETDVPAAIQRIVLRAVATDPEQRYPSVRALLDELAIDPGARRRRVLLAVAAIAVLGAGGAVLHETTTPAAAPTPCTGIGQRLAGVWDVPTRAAIHRAFLATKLPNAEQLFADLARGLDAYTAHWTAAVTDSCKATRIRGEQTEHALALRQGCFDERLQGVRALTALLADADKATVQKAGVAVGQLEELELCDNVALLEAPGSPPPGLDAKVHAIRDQLAVARAEALVGKYLPALVLSQQQLEAARALGWDPLIAEALLVRSVAFESSSSHEPARKLLTEATWAAVRGKHDDIALIAAESNALVIGSGLGKPADAQVWMDLARSLAARIGAPPEIQIQLDSIAGLVAAERGDLRDAIELHRRALAQGRALFGDDARVVALEMDLGVTLMRAGSYAGAAQHLERALAAREAVVGPQHPEIAILLSNLANCYGHTGDVAKAQATFDRAIALRAKLFGPNSFMMAAPLDNYAEFLGLHGRFAEGLTQIARAEQVEAPMGADHPDMHQIRTDHAILLERAGRLDDARAMFDELIRREEATSSPILPQTEAARAELAQAEKAYADAEAWAQKSVDAYVAAGGEDNVVLWRPLATLGQAKLALGKPADARSVLERAVKLGEQAGVSAEDLAPVRAALAVATRG